MGGAPIAPAWALAWAVLAAGCGTPTAPRSSNRASPAAEAPPAANARITQFYATAPNLPRGERELLCYGVENARSVRLSPPPEELSAAVSRCVEVNPGSTTRYTLTVEGFHGPPATGEVTVTVGPAHVKIIDVTVSSLSVARGTTVSLCYHVENAASVEIEPIGFQGRSNPKGCGTDTPRKTTTYVVTVQVR